jgi:hypothetical protein
MSTLHHTPAPVHPDWTLDREPWDGPEPPEVLDYCPTKRSSCNKWCYQLYPAEMEGWCDVCLDGHDAASHELPDWMQGTGDPIQAPGEPEVPMSDWIEIQASLVRLMGTDLARWLAGRIDELASACRSLDATTPEDFDGREAVLVEMVAEHDARSDSYPYFGAY